MAPALFDYIIVGGGGSAGSGAVSAYVQLTGSLSQQTIAFS
jgi:hypothetical protein